MNTTRKTSPFRYAVGMSGTSIPINMFKTYAAAFYVIGHGVTTAQFSMVLFLYTFVDAIDNPVYGFLFRQDTDTLGTAQALACYRRAAAGALLHCLFQYPGLLKRKRNFFLYAADVHTHRYAGFPHQCQLRGAFPRAFPIGCRACQIQRHAGRPSSCSPW